MVDFKGQQLSERIFQVVTVAATVIGFFYGWYEQSFAKTVEVWAVGVALSVVLCVPDWWFYRKNPIEWREEDYGVRNHIMHLVLRSVLCVCYIASSDRVVPTYRRTTTNREKRTRTKKGTVKSKVRRLRRKVECDVTST